MKGVTRPKPVRRLMFARLPAILVACLCIIGFARPLAAEDKASERPNILFAFADDWGRYASAYAKLEPGGISDLVSTPNFDRVAEEGVLFTRAFVNAPSCTPCRSSLLSGQHFWRTGRGAILQGAVWDDSIPTYPLLLEKEGGYANGFSLKVWTPGRPADAPIGGARTRHNRAGTQINRFSQTVDDAARQGTDELAATKDRILQQVRGNFQIFLDKRGEGQPFHYFFGPTNVHRTWREGSAQRIWGLDPEQLAGKLPPSWPDVPTVRQDVADYLGEVQAFDAALGVLIDELQDRGELENTVVVVSGDHGIPGMPRGKCNLYDLGTAVPLAIRYPKAFPVGRVVDDFVGLPDLAPTFLELGGVAVPEAMTARSLLPLLTSDKSGTIDPTRDAVVFGRERHVAAARTDFLPYPERGIRTADFLYIRTFKPDRWPMGTGPGFGAPDGDMPAYEALRDNTFAAFADLDASPTKAWILTHLGDADPKKARLAREAFELGFGRRPAEQLFDLRADPDQVNNVAADPSYATMKAKLAERLLTTLRETGDPRVENYGKTFEEPPFTDPPPPRRQKKPAAKPAAKPADKSKK